MPNRGPGKRPGGFFSFLVLLFVATSCASYTQETSEIRSLYRVGSYASALKKIDESSLKDSDRNRLLYLLERSMILDRMGRHKQARTLLTQADALADKLYTVSISRTASSFVVSDAVSDYSGEDYEKVAIHTQMALTFIEEDNLKSAMVEARKINSKLNEINQQYEDTKNRYAEDAFARYLAGLIHEADGNIDSAIIDYNKALETYQGVYAKEGFSSGVPDGLIEGLYRLLVERGRTVKMAELKKQYPKVVKQAEAESSGRGDLVVIHEVGQIAVKTTKEYFAGIGKQVIRFSFPVIKRKGNYYRGSTGVDVIGKGGMQKADHVQDMDAIAYATLEDRRLRLIAKQSARLLVKGQLTEQAYENFGIVGGLLANVFSAVTETADTRSWTLLPESYYITRLRLPAGTHKIKIKNSGKLSDIKTVKVRAGKVTLVRDDGK